MEEKGLISIIVPVYNAALFIEKTLHNLVEQKVNKEIILVNDGSTDNTLCIINKWANKYECIRVVNQANKGVSAARNTGIRNAKGEFLIFVDSDDRLAPNALKDCLGYFELYSIDCVLYSFQTLRSDSSIIKSYFYKDTGLYDIETFLNDFLVLMSNLILHCVGTKIYQTSIIRDGNLSFSEHLSFGEDIGFCLSYLKKVQYLYYINTPLYFYIHINPQSLITRYKVDMANTYAYLHKLEYELLTKTNHNDHSFRSFGYSIYYDIINVIKNEMHSNVKLKTKCRNINKLFEDKCVIECLNNSCKYSIRIRVDCFVFKFFPALGIYIYMKLKALF